MDINEGNEAGSNDHGEEDTTSNISAQDPLAVAVVGAIRRGEVELLQQLLAANPSLATARIEESNGGRRVARSLLHVATDWPGHFCNATASVKALIAAGADVNARVNGPHSETPLHWAASSDDTAVLDALLDAGADIEANGAVIGGGTPLADAVAFGQWQAARRLVGRGARTTLWQAAALGLRDRLTKHFAGDPSAALEPWTPGPRTPKPVPDEITHAFWCACHGGQRESAEALLARGANLNWIGYDGLTPLDAARRSEANELAAWLASRGARSSKGG